ncbi:tape measure protein [Clostridium botulinum]|nr:tape measure protein [Clostridium botulinum]NFR13696.1 tape measure protein [Clostridium botulinum]NFR42237.1 tape measure protein [Clostridium botulinum]
MVDGMSPVIKSMTNALNICINSFETMQNASSNAVDTTSLQTARGELANVESSFKQIEEGIRNSNQQQQQFNNTVNNGQNAVGGLVSKVTGLVGAYIGLRTVNKILDLSDTFVQTKARLDLMNYGLQTTEELQNMIFQSAQRSRGAYQTTADAISKLGMQARSAFSSNEELVAFTEQLNKNFVVAGTSVVGVESVMLQLTQSMAAGKLQGEELNAVLDNAQPIVQHIADYMNVPVGKIKDLASEGKITADIIKKAMFASAEETNKKFESMPITFSQVMGDIKNQALKSFQPVLQKINDVANNYNFNVLITNLANGIAYIANMVLDLTNTISNVAAFFTSNWGIIEPIIWGIVAALIVYNATMGIAWLTTLKNAASTVAKTVADWAETAAIIAMTIAQDGLNAALAMCPLTWILYAIIAIIAIIYVVIGAINKTKGTSISATGIIAGAFFMLGASIWNVVAYTWNKFASLAEFLANVFNHPIYSVKRLFVNLASNVLDACISMTSGIDDFATNLANGIVDGINVAIRAWNAFMNILPDSVKSFLHIGVGTEVGHTAGITGTLQSAKDSLQNWLGDAPSDYISIPKMEMKSMGGAFDSGYNWGANLFGSKDTAAENDPSKDPGFDYDSLLKNAEAASQGAGDTAKNTGAMKDSLDITEEDLKYLRDFAEMEAINQYTTASIEVSVENNNNINSDLDLDGIVDMLTDKIEEGINMTAEGVYDY